MSNRRFCFFSSSLLSCVSTSARAEAEAAARRRSRSYGGGGRGRRKGKRERQGKDGGEEGQLRGGVTCKKKAD